MHTQIQVIQSIQYYIFIFCQNVSPHFFFSAHSAASDLSPHGRDLLYNKSVEYARMLMEFAQQRFGAVAGAKRYAECMNLLDKMIRLKETGLMIATHIDLYHPNIHARARRNMNIQPFPKGFPLFCKSLGVCRSKN